MNLESIINTAKSYVVDNWVISLVIFVVFAVFAVKKTKAAVKFLVFVLLFFTAIYVATNLGNVSFKGLEEKREGVGKTKKVLEGIDK